MGTIIDIIILAICALLGIRGLFNGFVREVLSLVAFIVGYVIVLYFGTFFSQFLIEQFSIPSLVASISSSVLLFLAGYLIVKIIESSLSRFVNIIMLSGLNRISGCIVGILKGVIIVYLLVLLINTQQIFPDLKTQLDFPSSQLLPWVEVVSSWITKAANIF